MDISLKYKIAEKIIQSEDDTVLNEIKALIGVTDNDFWSELPDEVKTAIDAAKTQLDNGQGIPHKKVMAEIRNRFPKS